MAKVEDKQNIILVKIKIIAVIKKLITWQVFQFYLLLIDLTPLYELYTVLSSKAITALTL